MTTYTDLKARVGDVRTAYEKAGLHGENGAQIMADAIAAIEELEARNQWQPIETAPKDGTEVDLWSLSGTFYSDRWQRHNNMWFANGLNCWRNHKGDKRIKADLPTHWMPLPQPPEQDQ